MAHFNEKTRQIELNSEDLRHESPMIVKNFWEHILGGQKLIETPRAKKVNILN